MEHYIKRGLENVYPTSHHNKHLFRISLTSVTIGFIVGILLLSNLRDLTFQYVNWLLGGGIICSLTILLSKCSKRYFFILLFVLTVFIKNMLITSDLSREIKDSMNWLCTLEVLMACGNYKTLNKFSSYLEKHSGMIKAVIYIYTLELVLLLLIPQAYKNAWGSKVFSAFNVMQGTAANCCLSIGMTLYYLMYQRAKGKDYLNIIKKNRTLVISLVINMYAILQTQVRVVLIAILATLLLLTIILISKKINRMFTIGIGSVLFMIFLLNSSSFMAKMQYSIMQLSISGFSKIDALLSSRPIIWRRILFHFFEEDSLLNYFFGSGFARIYEINIQFGNNRNINAHSDIVQTLVAMGIVGLIILLVFSFKILLSSSKINKTYSFILCLYFLIPICVNGIMMTPQHVYSVLFIVLTIRMLETGKKL